MQDQSSPPAVIYASKSTADEHGSIPDQLAACRSRIEGLGRTVISEHSEDGQSGWKGDRGPELEAALRAAKAAVEQHGAAELWVWKSERLARGSGRKEEARSLLEVFTACRRAGVTLRSVHDDAYVQDEAMIGMASKMASKFSDDLSVNVKRGMKRRADRGQYTGPAPLGYRFADKSLIVYDPEVPLVRRIFSDWASGASLSQITRNLNSEAVPTKRGGKWRTATLGALLRHPVYIGRIRRGEETLDGTHEGIVDPELFEKAQARFAAQGRTRGKGRGRPTTGSHLFVGGLLRCGQCDEPLVPRTAPSGFQHYLCGGCQTVGCDMPPIAREQIDTAVYRYFESVGLDVEATRKDALAAVSRRVEEIQSLLASAEREAAQQRDRLARVKRAFQDGHLEPEDWAEQRAELTEAIEASEAEADRLRVQAAEVEAGASVADAEGEVLEQLAALREAIAGEVKESAGVTAVRAALARTFEVVYLRRGRLIPEFPESDDDLLGHDERLSVEAGSYWLEPIPTDRAIAGYDENLKPVIARTSVVKPKTNAVGGLPTGICFGPIPVGA